MENVIFVKSQVALDTNDRDKALDKLFDNQDRSAAVKAGKKTTFHCGTCFDNQDKTAAVKVKEIPVFQMYLNMAVTNLQDLARPFALDENMYAEEKVERQLKSNKPEIKEVVEKLANFLWLFQEDNPSEDYGEEEYRSYTVALVKRLYLLRNFFCHMNEKGIDALIADQKFYRFFAGNLTHQALNEAVKRNRQTDRLAGMKVMNPQEFCYHDDILKVFPGCHDAEDLRRELMVDPMPRMSKEEIEERLGVVAANNELAKDYEIRQENKYAFTRKGIVLLICMALYRDQAVEFCQALHDFKLVNNRWDEEEWEWFGQDLLPGEESNEMKAKIQKKTNSRQAFQDFFSYFSMKRSYNAVNAEDHNFACFADILGYLNKVPPVAWDYLSLEKERRMLAEKQAESGLGDKHRDSRFVLHKRAKDRTLSFLAGYCEDFELMKCIHFKRLDISSTFGRKRYKFGIENANDVRQNRHYAIQDNAIRFEWRAEKHYSDIHIDALHSAVSLDELRRMVIAFKSNCGFRLNDELDQYFTAYHRVLERILAEGECSFINRESYLGDLMAITCATREELLDDKTFQEKMAPYFPANLTRFFIPQDNIPTDQQLRDSLARVLRNQVTKDQGILKDMKALRDWRRLPAENRPRLQIQHDFNDGTLIHYVFRAMNLHLPADERFRQLPRGKQHNGCKDYEYQTMHAIIGRFGRMPKDAQAFWEKMDKRPSAKLLTQDLRNGVENYVSEEKKWLSAHPRFDANGKLIKARSSLEALSWASVKNHLIFCRSLLSGLESGDWGHERLMKECRNFGVPTGQSLSREAILRTVLKLDWVKWANAFNYKENRPWVDRHLEATGHIVPQVPLTNLFTALRMKPRDGQNPFFKNGRFCFGKALRETDKLPTGDVKLRDFYDKSFLMELANHGNVAGTAWDPALPEKPKEESEYDIAVKYRSMEKIPSKAEAMRKSVELADIEAQDYLLLYVLNQYHVRFAKVNDASNYKEKQKDNMKIMFDGGSVYEYFTKPEIVSFGRMNLLVRPNNRLRLIYPRIQANAEELANTYTPEELERPVDFYDAAAKFRRIEARDRRKRLEIMPLLFELEEKVGEEPVFDKSDPGLGQKRYQFYLPHVNGRPNRKQKAVPFEDFNFLIDVRNMVFHNGFNIKQEDIDKAKQVLRHFGVEES